MKRDDIVILIKPGNERELWCVLACGPKTFDLVTHSGYVERHRHLMHKVRIAEMSDFYDSEKYRDEATRDLRAQAAAAREERRTGARVKRGQIWPSR